MATPLTDKQCYFMETMVSYCVAEMQFLTDQMAGRASSRDGFINRVGNAGTVVLSLFGTAGEVASVMFSGANYLLQESYRERIGNINRDLLSQCMNSGTEIRRASYLLAVYYGVFIECCDTQNLFTLAKCAVERIVHNLPNLLQDKPWSATDLLQGIECGLGVSGELLNTKVQIEDCSILSSDEKYRAEGLYLRSALAYQDAHGNWQYYFHPNRCDKPLKYGLMLRSEPEAAAWIAKYNMLPIFNNNSPQGLNPLLKEDPQTIHDKILGYTQILDNLIAQLPPPSMEAVNFQAEIDHLITALEALKAEIENKHTLHETRLSVLEESNTRGEAKQNEMAGRISVIEETSAATTEQLNQTAEQAKQAAEKVAQLQRQEWPKNLWNMLENFDLSYEECKQYCEPMGYGEELPSEMLPRYDWLVKQWLQATTSAGISVDARITKYQELAMELALEKQTGNNEDETTGAMEEKGITRLERGLNNSESLLRGNEILASYFLARALWECYKNADTDTLPEAWETLDWSAFPELLAFMSISQPENVASTLLFHCHNTENKRLQDNLKSFFNRHGAKCSCVGCNWLKAEKRLDHILQVNNNLNAIQKTWDLGQRDLMVLRTDWNKFSRKGLSPVQPKYSDEIQSLKSRIRYRFEEWFADVFWKHLIKEMHSEVMDSSKIFALVPQAQHIQVDTFFEQLDEMLREQLVEQDAMEYVRHIRSFIEMNSGDKAPLLDNKDLWLIATRGEANEQIQYYKTMLIRRSMNKWDRSVRDSIPTAEQRRKRESFQGRLEEALSISTNLDAKYAVFTQERGSIQSARLQRDLQVIKHELERDNLSRSQNEETTTDIIDEEDSLLRASICEALLLRQRIIIGYMLGSVIFRLKDAAFQTNFSALFGPDPIMDVCRQIFPPEVQPSIMLTGVLQHEEVSERWNWHPPLTAEEVHVRISLFCEPYFWKKTEETYQAKQSKLLFWRNTEEHKNQWFTPSKEELFIQYEQLHVPALKQKLVLIDDLNIKAGTANWRSTNPVIIKQYLEGVHAELGKKEEEIGRRILHLQEKSKGMKNQLLLYFGGYHFRLMQLIEGFPFIRDSYNQLSEGEKTEFQSIIKQGDITPIADWFVKIFSDHQSSYFVHQCQQIFAPVSIEAFEQWLNKNDYMPQWLQLGKAGQMAIHEGLKARQWKDVLKRLLGDKTEVEGIIDSTDVKGIIDESLSKVMQEGFKRGFVQHMENPELQDKWRDVNDQRKDLIFACLRWPAIDWEGLVDLTSRYFPPNWQSDLEETMDQAALAHFEDWIKNHTTLSPLWRRLGEDEKKESLIELRARNKEILLQHLVQPQTEESLQEAIKTAHFGALEAYLNQYDDTRAAWDSLSHDQRHEMAEASFNGDDALLKKRVAPYLYPLTRNILECFVRYGLHPDACQYNPDTKRTEAILECVIYSIEQVLNMPDGKMREAALEKRVELIFYFLNGRSATQRASEYQSLYTLLEGYTARARESEKSLCNKLLAVFEFCHKLEADSEKEAALKKAMEESLQEIIGYEKGLDQSEEWFFTRWFRQESVRQNRKDNILKLKSVGKNITYNLSAFFNYYYITEDLLQNSEKHTLLQIGDFKLLGWTGRLDGIMTRFLERLRQISDIIPREDVGDPYRGLTRWERNDLMALTPNYGTEVDVELLRHQDEVIGAQANELEKTKDTLEERLSALKAAESALEEKTSALEEMESALQEMRRLYENERKLRIQEENRRKKMEKLGQFQGSSSPNTSENGEAVEMDSAQPTPSPGGCSIG